MNAEVRQRGAHFLVVTLTTGTQVHPDPKVRNDLAGRLDVDDLFYPDQRISALGEKEQFPVLNLSDPFLDYVKSQEVFLHGFENTEMGTGHWNADGHRLAAELLESQIVELFDVEDSPRKPDAP
jgi:hypothetical protein